MLSSPVRRNLAVLRLAVARNPPPVRLVCSWLEGDKQRWRRTVRFHRLGLSLDKGREERHSNAREADLAASFEVPREIVQRLLPQLDSGRPLWLSFQDGWLACLPWERWLQPQHTGPILRLPYLDFEPSLQAGGRLDVLVCASTPAASVIFEVPELLATTIEEVGADLPATFHVFVDRFHHPAVEQRLAGLSAAGRVTVYHPDLAASYGEAPRVRKLEDAVAVENPWLRWMLDSLPSQRVDHAIFLCHGYRSNGVGALAFAESPVADVDPHWARFVGPGQLTTFLDHAGASVLALGSPPSNFSVSGTWSLADDIAHRRPGPVVAIDVSRDSERAALGRALAFLAGRGPRQPPPSAAMALYCHPRHLVSPGMLEFTHSAAPLLGALKLKEFAASGVGSGDSWTLPSQRILERHFAQHLSLASSKTTIAAATRSGQEGALRYVAGLLENAVNQRDDGGEEQ